MAHIILCIIILLKTWTGWGWDWSLHPLLKWQYFIIDIKLVSRIVFKNDVYLCTCIVFLKVYVHICIHVDMCISLYCCYIGGSDIYIVDYYGTHTLWYYCKRLFFFDSVKLSCKFVTDRLCNNFDTHYL